MNARNDTCNPLVALVTGASSGLGESIAKNLARRGHRLILISENRTELFRVKHEIESECLSSVTVLEMDLFDPSSVERIFEFCESTQLAVDILVNCAGMFVNIDREMNDIVSIENVVNLHVTSLTKLCFLFGRAMTDRKRGYILNVSSINAEFLDPASLTYGPTKRYILALSEALHCEWKEHNVRVTCMTPGGIRTNFFAANRVYIPPVIQYTLLSSDSCAEIGLSAMFRGSLRVTPGIYGKLQSFFLKKIARPALYALIKKTYFSMKNRQK
ncbi:MAG: SDR family NAD(P)-dependent oxidoreductase [Spirochaetes bacterium]|nr:SDR family NAD(P)-dependent oxidoreductase [Spirochaetota bacterium]